MSSDNRARRGFTLIELMVTLAVIVVLAVAAVPSFVAMRQRAALRGAAEESLSLWNQARFEAAKRNSMVKYGVKVSGDDFCIGVATTTDAADETPCDCLTSTTACDVAYFPSDQAEWNNVTLAADPTLGQDTGVAVMDPKRAALTESADVGGLTFNGPPGTNAYQLNLKVDQFGRGVLCESDTTTSKMPDYSDRQCSP